MIVIRETVGLHHKRTPNKTDPLTERAQHASVAYRGYVPITAVCSYPHVHTTVQAITLLHCYLTATVTSAELRTATSKQLLVKTVFSESKFVDLCSNEQFLQTRVMKILCLGLGLHVVLAANTIQ